MATEEEGFIDGVRRLFSNPDLLILPITDAAALAELHLDDGVILFHAPWSGYSISNIARTLKAMRTSQWKPRVAICWCDAFSPEETVAAIGALCHGYGEGVVIRNKHTLAYHYKSYDFERFLQCIREQT